MGDTLLLPPVFDLDTGAEIVDEVTVDILVRGHRKVASTHSERHAAIQRLVRQGAGVRIIANHLGISIDDAKECIFQAGYQIVPDPMFRKASGEDSNRHHIVKVAS